MSRSPAAKSLPCCGRGWVGRLLGSPTASRRLTTRRSAPLGLSLRTFAVLATVAGGAARSQLEIAQNVGLDKTTLVATIDDLERRAFVLRKADSDDRRARIVEITAAGAALLLHAGDAVRATERRVLADMSPEHVEQIQASLIALLSGPLHAYFDRAGSCL